MLQFAALQQVYSTSHGANPQSFTTVHSHGSYRLVNWQACEQLLRLTLVGSAVYDVFVRHVQGVAIADGHVAATMQRGEASCVHVEACHAFRA